jgi:hypothetical protein
MEADDADKAAQAEHAAQLRRKIAELTGKSPPPGVPGESLPPQDKAPRKESDREFVQRRTREADRERDQGK